MGAAVCSTQEHKAQMDYGIDTSKQSVQLAMKCDIFTFVNSDGNLNRQHTKEHDEDIQLAEISQCRFDKEFRVFG